MKKKVDCDYDNGRDPWSFMTQIFRTGLRGHDYCYLRLSSVSDIFMTERSLQTKNK